MMIEHRNRIAGGSRIPWLKKMVLFFYQGFILPESPLAAAAAGAHAAQEKALPAHVPAGEPEAHPRSGDREKEYDVLLFPGCVFTYFYSQKIVEIKSLLEKQGLTVLYPPGLQCCGFPYLSQGWNKNSMPSGEKTSPDSRLRSNTWSYPVRPACWPSKNITTCPGSEIFELGEFLFKHCPGAAIDPAFARRFQGPFTYHDPCHNLKSLKLQQEARHFLEQFGKRFVNDDSALCCGFGGIFKVGFPSTSAKILGKKSAKLDELGVGAVVTSCPGCYMQLKESLPIPSTFSAKYLQNSPIKHNKE